MGVFKDNQGCSSVCSTSFSRVTIQSSTCPIQRTQENINVRVGAVVHLKKQHVTFPSSNRRQPLLRIKNLLTHAHRLSAPEHPLTKPSLPQEDPDHPTIPMTGTPWSTMASVVLPHATTAGVVMSVKTTKVLLWSHTAAYIQRLLQRVNR